MEAILELIKFRKDLGFEFELTCFYSCMFWWDTSLVKIVRS
jgi:hypothetical protein